MKNLLKNPSKKVLLSLLISIILIASLSLSAFLFIKYKKTSDDLKKLSSDPKYAQNLAKADSDKLIAEVGKIILLPKEETPTIATITDIDKLKSAQPFFNNAKNGDKLLVYSNKAIIYDPIDKKIIEIGPINPASQSAQNSPQPLKITILNGTTKVGLTKKFEDLIKSKIATAETTRDNAKLSTYTKSVLVDLNSSKPNETQQLSQLLNIPSGSLPETETKPEGTDFLIILGTDKENP